MTKTKDAKKNIKILYLAGWGRSGSTILSNTLGEIEGFISVGEIFNLWKRGIVDNTICGCQKPFSECPCWQNVLENAFGWIDNVDIHHVLNIQKNLSNTDMIFHSLLGKQNGADKSMDQYFNILQRLYGAIAETSKSRVIVDSSKLPFFADVLNRLTGVDLYILHLVRDPRAVAFSWMKKKRYDANTYMDRHSPLKSTLIWVYWNTLVELMWKKNSHYLFLRYEDFIRKPTTVLDQILNFTDEDASYLPAFYDHSLYLHQTHIVSGNPSRYHHGFVQLKPDDQWRTNMLPRHKALVNCLALPLLMRYGYL